MPRKSWYAENPESSERATGRRGGRGWDGRDNLPSGFPNPIQSNLIRRIACSAQQYKVGSALCPRALGVITLTNRCRPTSVFPL